MPGEHEDPDLTETAVLPHIEGPPLVRPYVPAPVEQTEPQSKPQAPDAFGTTVMPPVPPQPPRPPQPLPQAHSLPQAQLQPDFRIPMPPRQTAALPSPRHALPLGRRRAVILAAGAGIAALGVGIAFTLSSGSDSGPSSSADQSLPATVGSLPATTSEPSSAAPSASKSASPSPSHSPTRSKAPTSKPPVTVSASIAPPPAPSTSAPAPTPSTSTAPRTLSRGMSGADVTEMQQRLVSVGYRLAVTGYFDSKTEQRVAQFQDAAGVYDDPYGVYGPATRQALQGASG